jgi:endonuclease G
MLVSAELLKKESNQDGRNVVIDNTNEKFDARTDGVKETPLIKSITKGNLLDKDKNLQKRKEMISEKRFEPTEFAYERAIGRNDSLYSNFTELIALTKRKVGRIVLIQENERRGYATGFMVSNSLLLTNWHVFRNSDMAAESEVQFFYEYDSLGHPLPPVIFKFDNTKFFNNEELDYCFVGVQPLDISGKISLESIGYLFLDKALGKIGEVDIEKLNIIHHPQGDYKQISIRENTFVGIEPTKIFYETDTAQGSSGSPVFNDQWQVVGLHHKSIARMNETGNYLDKDNNIIPIINGEIDTKRVVWMKNEGIRISVILNHITEKNPGNEIIKSLDVPPPREILNFSVSSSNTFFENQNNNFMNSASNTNININVPVSALSSENSIEISLSSKKLNTTANVLTKIEGALPSRTEDMLLEIAKTEREDAVDFSNCDGYNPDFLGVHIPMPKLKKSLERQAARLKDDSMELKYFKYSVIFNSVTKMPIISAVNVEGDEKLRKDLSKRKDNWLRDVRIDRECQLTDRFYEASKFEKGHMSRFEDANWDKTEKDALRNGIYTCFYTNACPQVKKLNGSGGMWGKLEKAVLEKGIKKQVGDETRMTVFNGPIFNDDVDRQFRGVIIPMEFFKIVLWLDGNKLKATAFKLSQKLLVNIIKFDKIDEEAIDIHKDSFFRESQCSIKSLSSITKIDFSYLEQYDTFKSVNDGEEEVFLKNEDEIRL